MKISGNTILITGGATGIGFALADVFSEAGNEVIICGRRLEKLDQAKRRLPRVKAIQCDISDAKDRSALFNWTVKNFPTLNILVNNAGIQRQIDFRKGTKPLSGGEDEIETNFRAPVHLAALFIPHLKKQQEAAIVNISSGLAFIPLAAVPVYCATKAAIHSFSLSLRHQLRETSIKVFESFRLSSILNCARAKENRGDRRTGASSQKKWPCPPWTPWRRMITSLRSGGSNRSAREPAPTRTGFSG